MRTFTATLALLLLVSLFVSISAMRTPHPAAVLARSPTPSAVTVPFKWCGASTDDATISSVTSNVYPPAPQDTMTVNITGSLTTPVSGGGYSIDIQFDGQPLPELSGELSELHSLPWPVGDLNLTYTTEVPEDAESGHYVVTASAHDEKSVQIFCFSLSFDIGSGRVAAGRDASRLHRQTDVLSRTKP